MLKVHYELQPILANVCQQKPIIEEKVIQVTCNDHPLSHKRRNANFKTKNEKLRYLKVRELRHAKLEQQQI